MKTLIALIAKICFEIKYFIYPYSRKTIAIDPKAYCRVEYAWIDDKAYPFYSADLYTHRKGILSCEKVYLEKNWEKVWCGTIPINGVDTRIAFNIRNDVLTVVRRGYPNWIRISGRKDSILNQLKV